MYGTVSKLYSKYRVINTELHHIDNNYTQKINKRQQFNNKLWFFDNNYAKYVKNLR